MTARTMQVGGEFVEYWTTCCGYLDWVANTETRTVCGPTEDAAIRDLHQSLTDDVVTADNPRLSFSKVTA